MDFLNPSRLYFSNSIVILRPINEDDIQTLFNWRTDPIINKYLTSPAPKNMQDQRQWFWKYQHDTDSLFFMIRSRALDNIKIGYCLFSKIDGSKGCAEFGIVIGNKDYLHQGFGHKLMPTCMKIAYQYLGIHTLYSNVHSQNLACLTVVQNFIGSEPIIGPHPYRKDNEVLLRLDLSDFEAFEEKILLKNEKWRNILFIEQAEM
ncbi:GNAT family N-acetyltransferase [candidate division CSSED10-310 bacterium]|uniref:GNAT family N-acetyltransferase n=1 Tax=candidate division CSSED10-310 bacterium TaxID=2855610 RepID=A0ABV6YSY1_UNCC1